MLRTLSTAGLGVLVVGATLGSQLYANPGAAPEPSPQVDTVETTESLSPQQMQTHAVAMRARMTSQVQDGRQLLVTARHDKDQLKLGCVNQGQFVSERLLEISNDAVLSLGAALRTGNRAQQVASYKRVAQAAAQCDEAVTGIGSCASTKDVAVAPLVTDKVIVKAPKLFDDPTDDCNNLGLSDCAMQPLEYVAFGSPYTPD